MYVRLLEPFIELCNKIPDVNDKRAKRQGEFVFTEDPLKWDEDFPRVTVDIDGELNPREFPGQTTEDLINSYNLDFNIKITYYCKRLTEYNCPDGVMRKGKAFVEYMLINHILPIISQNKSDLIRKFCFIEIIMLKNIGKVFNVDEYGLGITVILGVMTRMRNQIPISNDGFIKEINIHEDIN